MSVIYHYARYHAPGSFEMDSVDEALSQARYDIEYNEAAPKRIEEDGRVVFDGHAVICEEIHRRERSGEMPPLWQEVSP
jgi:hypothetical protein